MDTTFRRLDPNDYPEVAEYSWDEIYGNGDNMAPGGLYLAAAMSRYLNVIQGDVVLDIGCGRGDSSIFLAKHFGVQVICFDLWTSSTYLSRKIEQARLRGRVIPVDLDATEPLPLPDDYFDAMFCMQSLHTFGENADVLRRLIGCLKPGGRFVAGGTCFSDEFEGGVIPRGFAQTEGWDADYDKYHSPAWWRGKFEETRLVDVIESRELPEGVLMWEDDVAYRGERAGWSDDWYQISQWRIDHIVHSRSHRPYLTHFLATVEKHARRSRRSGPASGSS